MPQQPPTTFRIEDLRARLKLEPKSRLFYPLAEELRKFDRHADAEKVLRDGLAVHAGYTSAWISLGRVLQEQHKYREAIEPLQKAFALDPGNVVAARLMADAYLALGERVEAIKKYKLVRALMPGDEEIEAVVERLEQEIRQSAAVSPTAPPSPQAPAEASPAAAAEPLSERTTDTEPFLAPEPAVPLTPAFSAEGPVPAVDVDAAMRGGSFTAAAEPFAQEIVPPRSEVVGAEEVAAEERRDFPLDLSETVFPEAGTLPALPESEEPFPTARGAVLASQGPDIFDETMPLSSARPPLDLPAESPFATATMAELYAQQGDPESAREIYNKLLDKEPQNASIREKLESLAAPSSFASEPGGKNKVVNRLEGWLTKVARK
jgi:tetratricopeptide (TPR) repeat protein